MPDWIRKPGVTAHPLEAVLQDRNGPIDLPPGTTVITRAKLPGEPTLKINAAASIVNPGASVGDPDRGRVMYTLQVIDLNEPGIYEVDFLANIPLLGEQVFPEDGYSYLLVLEGADST
jgi:hypothetical protein